MRLGLRARECVAAFEWVETAGDFTVLPSVFKVTRYTAGPMLMHTQHERTSISQLESGTLLIRQKRYWRVLTVCMGFGLGAMLCGAQTQAPPVDTAALNRTPEVKEAFDHFYNLDYDGALSRFAKIQQQHPQDPMATDYILYVTIFQELNRLDLLDTTFYANDGFLTGNHTVVEDPVLRDRVKQLGDQAVTQANTLLDANKDQAGKGTNGVSDSVALDALYARGWARSLDATYIALVERSFTSALRMALGARGDHADVLKRDPSYVDANLVVGTYEYVVGALPLSFRLVIGIAGISGSKEKGMQMLQTAAAHGVITSVEARTCMMLFLRREAKYAQAQQVAHSLAAQYPRDFLFLLEEANLAKDAGGGMQAVELYHHLIALTQQPGYFHSVHTELAYYGLGDSLRGQKMYPEALTAYLNAAATPRTSPELKRRCLLSAGKTYDLMGDHARAATAYQQVISSDGKSVQADEARKLLKKPYSAG